MIKKIAFILALIMLLPAFIGCDNSGDTDEGSKTEEAGVQLLSFSQAARIEEMQKLDGKEVTLNFPDEEKREGFRRLLKLTPFASAVFLTESIINQLSDN